MPRSKTKEYSAFYGVPGEENLDVIEVITPLENRASSLRATSKQQHLWLQPFGRLTGQPGVCLSTLGPGALNFSTGAGYALLGAMPMVLITGQKGILTSKQARVQIVDIVSRMTPLTKMARQIVSTATIPTIVREAFRVARQERPGPVHLELPEDIAAEEVNQISIVPPHPIEMPVAHPAALDTGQPP